MTAGGTNQLVPPEPQAYYLPRGDGRREYQHSIREMP